MLALGFALLMASVCLILVEYASLRSSLAAGVEVQMRIVAGNSVGALMFKDDSAAEEILSSLSASPDIDAAAIYDGLNQRFAEYSKAGEFAQLKTPQSAEDTSRRSGLHHTEFWQPVTYAGNRIGMLYVRANLTKLYRQLAWYIATTSMVMLTTLFAAAILLGRLQRAVVHAEERVGYLVNYDTVTHLPNRYAFNQRFQTLLDEAYRTKLY